MRISGRAAETLLADAQQFLVVSSSTSNGSVSGFAFIADEVSWSGYSLMHQFVVVQDEPLAVGLIGGLVLQQFYLVFDLSRGQILLRQDREMRYQLSEPATQVARVLAPQAVF